MSAVTAGSSKEPGQDFGGEDRTEWSGNYLTNILHLNDDCLRHVFSFLTLREQVIISETCARFHDILEVCYKNSLIVLHDEILTLMEFEHILVKAGHRLHRIDTIRNELVPSDFILQLIARRCGSLRELHLLSVRAPYLSAYREIGNLHNLTKLSLPHCHITDGVCQNLVPLQNLEYIDLNGNFEITGKYLNCLPKLVHLSVEECGIVSCFFNSICKKGVLKWLNIRSCRRLYHQGLSDAILSLKHLQELRICTGYFLRGINKITRLRNLKVLNIIHNPVYHNVPGEFLHELVENKGEKLESLTIHGSYLCEHALEYCFKFKNLKKLTIFRLQIICDEFVKKISNLKQLKYLGLPFCHSIHPETLINLFEQQTEIVELEIYGNCLITNEDYFEIAERIKARGTESPCTIYAESTGISQDILKDPRYMAYAPFVSLSFKLSISLNNFRVW